VLIEVWMEFLLELSCEFRAEFLIDILEVDTNVPCVLGSRLETDFEGLKGERPGIEVLLGCSRRISFSIGTKQDIQRSLHLALNEASSKPPSLMGPNEKATEGDAFPI
jgi:hypothetical protein